MVNLNRSRTTVPPDKNSVIFLDKGLFLVEKGTTRMHADAELISSEFITALKELQKRFSLVIVEESGEQDTAAKASMNAILSRSGVDITTTLKDVEAQEGTNRAEVFPLAVIDQFSRSNSIPPERRYFLHTGLKLTCFSDERSVGTGSYLPEILTLSFHTYDDLISWILSHPQPYRNLRMALQRGGDILAHGGLVAFPTETVYGLGADATDPNAVKKIFSAKKRPFFDPLIVHVSDRAQMLPLVTELPEKASLLITQFWPGPLTVVLPKSALIPEIVTAGFPSVAIRMPSNPLALELIRLSGKPIAAPSANLFGCTSPTTARHVEEQLGGAYDAIIDGGGCTVGIESTVISFVEEIPRILRPGGIDRAAVEACIGKVVSGEQASPEDISQSPGMLPSHYATATPLRIVEDLTGYASRKDVGVLLFGTGSQVFSGPVEYLSLSSDTAEAAMRLYQAMRRLDSLSLSLIVVKLLPEDGIGLAVNNRLQKAAANLQ